MSSGIKGNPLVLQRDFEGSDVYRIWSGSDGRTDVTTAGKVRSKWNGYSVLRASRTRNQEVIRLHLTNGSSVDLVGGGISDFLCFQWPSYSNSLETTAQARLVDAIRGHSFNLAVNAAQSRQLVDMVVTNLGKLGRAISALRHGDFSSAARQLGARPRGTRLVPSDISGRWLELQYGWLPSLSDAFAAAEAYEKLTKFERTSTVVSSAKEVFTVQASANSFLISTLELWKQRISYTYELSEVLSAPRSLGLQDPLSVAWELIPYSFVVDWFIPIGTYLDNLAILPHLKGRWLKQYSTANISAGPYTWVAPLPGNYLGYSIQSVEIFCSDNKRGLMAQRHVGADAIPVAFPGFDSRGLHGKRIWNAIALAYQRFGR